jgi:micrococcal nuclease
MAMTRPTTTNPPGPPHRRRREGRATWRAVLALVALSWAAVEHGSGFAPAASGPSRKPAIAQSAVVASITDGDTIRVRSNGERHTVRLLAVDAPEVGSECGASKATAYVRDFVPPGSTVWLEPDVEDRDRYGRLLRYVWRADGQLLNARLVRAGWAVATHYLPNDRRWATMQQAEQAARAARAGIWARCAPPR